VVYFTLVTGLLKVLVFLALVFPRQASAVGQWSAAGRLQTRSCLLPVSLFTLFTLFTLRTLTSTNLH
jgi:hypothetical protein